MSTQEITPGTLVHDRYIVRVRIGEGGGGIVYRAYDTNLESWVILKQIKESTVGPDERRTEVNVLKELRHQRIPKVLDYFTYGECVCTVMDFINGRDFGAMLREYGRFGEKSVLKWAGQLADVLAYIHSRKPPIVHSDVKPSNIMVDQYDEVTLIDFNISRIFQKEKRDGTWISAGYSPPEQFGNIAVYERFRRDRQEKENQNPILYREKLPEAFFSKEIDPRSDVYSFGATLYHLLTGVRPDPFYECICPISKTGVPVSAGLAAVIERCMQADQDLRYRNGGEIVDALNALQRGANSGSGENKNTITPPVNVPDKRSKPDYRNQAGPGGTPGYPDSRAAMPGGGIYRGAAGGEGPASGEAAGRSSSAFGEYTERFLHGTKSDIGFGEFSDRYGRPTAASPDGVPDMVRTDPYAGERLPDRTRGTSGTAGKTVAGRDGTTDWTTGTEGIRKSRNLARILAAMIAVIACAIIAIGIVIWRTEVSSGSQSGSADEVNSGTGDVQESKDSVSPDSSESGPVSESEPVLTAAPEPVLTTTPTPTASAAPKPTAQPVPSSLKCTVSESAPSNLKSLKRYPFDTSDASSYLVQNTAVYYDNQPHSAADGDFVTSWQEGAAGLGIGETLWLGYNSPKKISCLVLHLGNWRTEEIYGNNARPKSLRLRIGSWSQELTFNNGMTVKYVTFSEPCEADELEFVITAVYEGIDQDCCISEIEAYGS